MPIGVTAVSYTHLDVYKRQEEEYSLFVVLSLLFVWVIHTQYMVLSRTPKNFFQFG